VARPRGRSRIGRWARPLLGLLALSGVEAPYASAAEVAAGTVHVSTLRLDLEFSLDGAAPIAWRACHASCAEADLGSGTSVRFVGRQEPSPIRLILQDHGSPLDLQRLRFTAEVTEDARARMVTFQTELPVDGLRVAKSFEISKEGYEVVMTVRLLEANGPASAAGRHLVLELDAGRGLTAAPAAGVAAMLERVGRVRVTEGTARDLDEGRRAAAPLGAGEWAGVRNRFWALLVRPDGAGALERPSDPRITLRSEGPSWRYTFFSGPVESQALAHADPALKGLLFSGLWSPLRALSFALLSLLRGLSAVVPHPGVAIIALAFSVRILLLPLTILAERLQEQVDATRTRLQPGIDAIRASHRGEEQARRTWALYRAEGVHPLYTLKSLLGVAIQLPVFIAVFDMLAEDFDLYRASFLWIADLSQPDALLPLPLCVPFFGCHVNLLPFLMSAISLTALLRFRSPVLAPSLERRQRRTLMGITLAFFLLFYTFPAGMVLYWTSTNAFQLVKQELMRPRRERV